MVKILWKQTMSAVYFEISIYDINNFNFNKNFDILLFLTYSIKFCKLIKILKVKVSLTKNLKNEIFYSNICYIIKISLVSH